MKSKQDATMKKEAQKQPVKHVEAKVEKVVRKANFKGMPNYS